MEQRYVRGANKGELKTPYIIKLIRAHNYLTDIKLPKNPKRSQVLEAIEKKKYMIDHEKGALLPKEKTTKNVVVGKPSIVSIKKLKSKQKVAEGKVATVRRTKAVKKAELEEFLSDLESKFSKFTNDRPTVIRSIKSKEDKESVANELVAKLKETIIEPLKAKKSEFDDLSMGKVYRETLRRFQGEIPNTRTIIQNKKV